MNKKAEDLEWHSLYEGSGSVAGGSWFEEVAYLGDGKWLLRIYDDPAWTLAPEEPMEPETIVSASLVDLAWTMDTASEEDASTLPRVRALLEAAELVADETTAIALKRSLSDVEPKNPKALMTYPPQDITFVIGPPGLSSQKERLSVVTQNSGQSTPDAWHQYVHTIFRSLLEKANTDQPSQFDTLLSKVLGHAVKLDSTHLGTALIGGYSHPTVVIPAGSISAKGGDNLEPASLSGANDVLASVFGDLLKADWVRYI